MHTTHGDAHENANLYSHVLSPQGYTTRPMPATHGDGPIACVLQNCRRRLTQCVQPNLRANDKSSQIVSLSGKVARPGIDYRLPRKVVRHRDIELRSSRIYVGTDISSGQVSIIFLCYQKALNVGKKFPRGLAVFHHVTSVVATYHLLFRQR